MSLSLCACPGRADTTRSSPPMYIPRACISVALDNFYKSNPSGQRLFPWCSTEDPLLTWHWPFSSLRYNKDSKVEYWQRQFTINSVLLLVVLSFLFSLILLCGYVVISLFAVAVQGRTEHLPVVLRCTFRELALFALDNFYKSNPSGQRLFRYNSTEDPLLTQPTHVLCLCSR
jgi:hypothetical protein